MSKNLYNKRTRLCTVGLLFNRHALWIGAHYSPYNRRLCINLIPCLTVWVTLPGGKNP